MRIVYGGAVRHPRIQDGIKIGADEATEICRTGIARLLPEAYRGFYADKLRRQTTQDRADRLQKQTRRQHRHRHSQHRHLLNRNDAIWPFDVALMVLRVRALRPR
ncbi:MAG: hypothetical protein R2839_02340 [Thermomicrobiales bacterium]